MGKILITGAAGFIGSHLVEYLIQDGVDRKNLRLFVLHGESLENLPDDKFDIIRGDIQKLTDVKKAMKDITTVYHLAALTMHGEGKYLEVNWKGTINLLKACKSKKIRKFVFFSSIAVFGLPAFIGDREDINEGSEKKVIGEYAESKHKADLEIIKAHKEWGLPYAIVRPTTVYGPKDKAGLTQLFRAIQKGYFFRIGNGKNKVDYVYVEDLVKGARKAELSRSNASDYILGSGKPISFNLLVDCVSDSLGKRIPRWYIPRPFALVVAFLVELISKISEISLPLAPDRVKVMTANYYFSSAKARREIGYEPRTSFQKGAKITGKWLIRNNKI